MEIKDSNMVRWSRIGSRATFGLVALELAKEIDDLMILTGDVHISAGLGRYKKSFPEKYLDVGIAEQNLMGIAAGLSSEGTKVITTTFAPFQTMRCLEQIKVNLGYMNHDVCMVGLASGLVLGTLGYTHCSIEDLAITRSIPGMTVLSPADCGETAKAIFAAVDHKGPVYIRLTGGTNSPIVYKKDYNFKIGKAIQLKKGEDISIISTGTMVYPSLEAAEILHQQGISAAVIDMHTIKPIDNLAIKKASRSSKLIFTVEEHNVVGGLGSAVSESLSAISRSPSLIMIGLPDKYGKGGEYKDLLNSYGLTSTKIANKIKKEYMHVG